MLRLFKLSLTSALLCFFVNCEAFPQETTTIEAKVSKSKVETGEVFLYAVNIEGNFASPKLNLPDFKNFVVASRQETRNYTTKDNKLHLSLKLNYGLIATKPGTFAIDGLNVEDKGKKIKANALIIEVTGKPVEEQNKMNPYGNSGVDI